MLSPSLETVRIFLHVIAASIWVGGQFVLAGVVPDLRKVGSEATKAAANGFAKVAWPAYGLTWVTGIWNLLSVEGASTAYHVTLGIKILLVVAAGAAAWVHSVASKRAVMAATGAAGGVLSVVILFLGVLLSRPG